MGRHGGRPSNSQIKLVILGHSVPVHHVPPGLDVIGPAVLVIQIVSVLPNVDSEDRSAFSAGNSFSHQRTVLIGSGNNFQVAAVAFNEPGPAAAEPLYSGVREFFLKLIKSA